VSEKKRGECSRWSRDNVQKPTNDKERAEIAVIPSSPSSSLLPQSHLLLTIVIASYCNFGRERVEARRSKRKSAKQASTCNVRQDSSRPEVDYRKAKPRMTEDSFFLSDRKELIVGCIYDLEWETMIDIAQECSKVEKRVPLLGFFICMARLHVVSHRHDTNLWMNGCRGSPSTRLRGADLMPPSFARRSKRSLQYRKGERATLPPKAV